MKINANVNVQSKNWNNVKNHIERTFEDNNLSQRNWDSNLGIDWKLSHLNKSSDGKIINTNNPNHPYQFKFNKRNYNHLERLKRQAILRHAKPFVERYNNSKSVKNNPNRKINDPLKLFKKNNERTTVDSFSGSLKNGLQTNFDNIKLIQHYYGRGYKNARIRYTKAISQALANYERGFNNRYKHVKKFHWCSNVDETTGLKKPSNKPDALHAHSQLLGFAWSKYDKTGSPIIKKYQTKDKNGKVHNHRAGKPSFDVPRALCHEFGIKYSKNNAHKAVSKFDNKESKEIVKDVKHVLAKRFSKVPEFRSMTYTPTKSEETGLSQNQIKRLANYKNQEKSKIANANRNKARRVQNELRKIQKIKANRKRNRKRAREAIIKKHRAESRYKDLNSKSAQLVQKNTNLLKDNMSLTNRMSTNCSTAISQSSANSSMSMKLSSINRTIKSQHPQIAKNQNIISNQQVTINNLNHQESDLHKIINKLIQRKNNLEKWLCKKWVHFKKIHLNAFYHGLARGIKYACPSLKKDINDPNNKDTYMDFATGKYSWGSKEKGHVSGIKLFIRGLASQGKGFFGHYNDSKDLENSFKKDPKRHRTPRIPNRDSDLTP